jgi:hypothetical protein
MTVSFYIPHQFSKHNLSHFHLMLQNFSNWYLSLNNLRNEPYFLSVALSQALQWFIMLCKTLSLIKKYAYLFISKKKADVYFVAWVFQVKSGVWFSFVKSYIQFHNNIIIIVWIGNHFCCSILGYKHSCDRHIWFFRY